MIKIVLYTILGVLGAVLLYLAFLAICAYVFVDPKKEYTHNSRFYRHLLYFPTRIVLFLIGVRIHTTGLEKMPEGRFLIVSNHRSNFDPLVSWRVLEKYDIAYISKFSNFKIPIWGRIIRKCCFLGINREDAREGMKTIIKAIKLIKEDEVSIGIYPEGTRSKTCELLPFHPGSFKVAQSANVPIVVVTVQGTEMIHRNFPFHGTDVRLDLLEVIPAETVKAMKTTEIAEHVHKLMAKHLGEISQEIEGERNETVHLIQS
mgnify:CR=1 FL=1